MTLEAENTKLRQENNELRAENKELRVRVAELQRTLAALSEKGKKSERAGKKPWKQTAEKFLHRSTHNFHNVALVFILIVAALLRLVGLDNQSFWNDELSSWHRSNFDSLSEVFRRGVIPDVHPPGYQVGLYFVERYIGDSEAVLRLPSAIAGVLTVYAMFVLGRRLFSHQEGLIAAAFTAVLWCPVYYSQEARPYAVMLLLTVLSAILLLSIVDSLKVDERPSPLSVIGYVFTAALTLYTHYFGLLMVGLQAVIVVLFLARKRQSLSVILPMYFAIALAYLPWLPELLEDMSRTSWIQSPPTFAIAFWEFLLFLFNKSESIVFLILTVYVLFFLYRLSQLYDRQTGRILLRFHFTPELLLLFWLVAPFVIVYVKSVISTPALTNRNLIIAAPAAYLLAARAITQLLRRNIYHALAVTAFLAIFLVDLLFVQAYYSTPQKEQFREAVDFVVLHDAAAENPLIIGYVWNARYLDYYFDKLGSSRRVGVLAGAAENIAEVTELINAQEPDQIWFIRAHRKPDEAFIEFLNDNLELIEHQAFFKADVWLYENK